MNDILNKARNYVETGGKSYPFSSDTLIRDLIAEVERLEQEVADRISDCVGLVKEKRSLRKRVKELERGVQDPWEGVFTEPPEEQP